MRRYSLNLTKEYWIRIVDYSFNTCLELLLNTALLAGSVLTGGVKLTKPQIIEHLLSSNIMNVGLGQ